ncbi:MAG: putative bifunctional diguanylate cyclase/phosphodiesterase [Hyphomicrobiaceae bacterium]
MEKHILYFAASALDLSDSERRTMRAKADDHLNQFRTAITKLLKSTDHQILPEEREGLRKGLSEIFHNWGEVSGQSDSGMSDTERSFHFLSLIDQFEILNGVLLGIHKRVSTEQAENHTEVFSNIEIAILTIVGLMICGTCLTSIGIGGSNYLLDKSRAQAAQLRESNDQLRRREEALHLQADRFSSAVEHLAQGLCMINKDHRLITWNRKFADMYGIPEKLLQQGLPFLPVLEHRISSGTAPENCPEFVSRGLGAYAASAGENEIHELPDGRHISVSYEPTPEGGLLSTHEDITNRRRSEREIIHLAHHDGLTNLLNRRSFVESFGNEIDNLKANGALTLFTVDLDGFKLANDKFGHAAGDWVLCEVSARLKACTRSQDLVARVGGDEFAVVIKDEVEERTAEDFASRILAELSKPYDFEGQPVEIGASVGVAMAPRDAREVGALLKMADIALYEAKNDRGNQFRLFSKEMREKIFDRRRLEESFVHAMEQDQLALYYQPLICAQSNLVTGMEALLRWHHPERGIIPPTIFIPIAEDLGMMGKVGNWVLEQACQDAMKWPSPVRVAVNVSAAQFHTRTLDLDVSLALGKSGLSGERLELEITESVLLDDDDRVLRAIDNVQDMGVSVAIDDFGTGFSSLSYLHKYPLDKIKIDRSFVVNLPKSNHSLSIVRTIVSLARSMGMSTTAEGIETREQHSLLRQEGCEQLQGYLFSKPVPACEAVQLISTLNSARNAA